VALRHQRRTPLLRSLLEAVALALAGRAGARLATLEHSSGAVEGRPRARTRRRHHDSGARRSTPGTSPGMQKRAIRTRNAT
jgi:hypothetical protein